MRRRPPRSTRTDTLFPYTTLFRSPQRSLGAIDTLLRASYDLQPQPVATDYLAAATGLSLRQHRRGLLMLVTNLRDEDSEDLLAAVRMLQRRNPVVVARSEERRVGKEGVSTCRCRGSPDHYKKNKRE